MSEPEYEVLDELYFIKSYSDLQKELKWPEITLHNVLRALWDNGWVRCYTDPVNELFAGDVNLESNYTDYHYLASKDGLIAHNSIE